MIAHWLDKYIRDQQQPATRLIQAVSKFEFTEEEETQMPKPYSGWKNHETEQVCLLMSNDWNYYKAISDLEERPDDLFNYHILVIKMRKANQLNSSFRTSQVDRLQVIEHVQYIWETSRGLDEG